MYSVRNFAPTCIVTLEMDTKPGPDVTIFQLCLLLSLMITMGYSVKSMATYYLPSIFCLGKNVVL